MVELWQALLVSLAPVAVLLVLTAALRAPAVAYVLVGAWALLFALPAWFVPLRRASSHDGETILQSVRRHYRRFRR